ncbi:unnamed protein product [Brachionus calyciflorus]|uniref:Uncharacterized protein n=1 Tax=Brachionus calyciflorus TaxID=104777 RepID=A0A813PT10_9BILA|nr:unnamed protein product [Brachionus calyciflorus]
MLTLFQIYILSLAILLTASEYFTKNKNFDFNESNDSVFLISKKLVPKFFECVKACKFELECAYFTYKFTECSLYTKYAIYIKKVSQSSEIYTRLLTFNLNGLSYYWPVFNSSANDVVSKADLYGPVNAIFISNRQGIPNSAIRLSIGYYNLPARKYFDGDFTLMAWIRLTKTVNYQRFIDCGINKYVTVVASLSDGSTNKPYFAISNENSQSVPRVISAKPLILGVWYHLTFNFKNKTIYYFRNGVLDISGKLDNPISINRTVCFLGKSQYQNDPNTSADFDDIKLFNKALNDDEILNQYHKNY